MQTTQTEAPTTIGPPLATDDPRAIFAKAVDLAGRAIGEVRPEQLDGPTPCTEMSVRQLLGHLVEVLQRVTALGRGEDPFAARDAGAPDDGWLGAWSEAVQEVQAAWSDDAVLDRSMHLPWVQGPGRLILLSYVSEVTVHTWDLATATGQQPAWDPQVVEVAYAGIHGGLPAADRLATFEAILQTIPAEMRAVAPPFADVVPVAAGAPLIDRLVAWTGRHP